MKNSQKQLLEVLNPKRLLENVAKFKVKYLCRNLFLIKLQPVGPELYLNETLTHVFCEFSKMFQNTILIGHLQTTTSFLDTTASELSEHEIISEITEAATGMLHKKAVLKNFLVFIGKHLCWSIFLNKVAGLQANACVFLNTYLEEHQRPAASEINRYSVPDSLTRVYRFHFLKVC